MASRGVNGFGEIARSGPSGIPGNPPLGPYPDDLLGDLAEDAQGPDARYSPHESISMVFVAALQHLPPWSRAALVLCDVFGFRLAEAAEILDASTETVNAALSQARIRIAGELPPGWRDQSPRAGSTRERETARRFADAFERGDADDILALLTDDAWLTTPPLPFGYRGRAAAQFLSRPPLQSGPPPTPAAAADGADGAGGAAGGACEVPRQFRLVATRANGQPAFGCYLSDPATRAARAHSLLVLTLDGDRVSGITRFTDNSVLRFFGLPTTLPR